MLHRVEDPRAIKGAVYAFESDADWLVSMRLAGERGLTGNSNTFGAQFHCIGCVLHCTPPLGENTAAFWETSANPCIAMGSSILFSYPEIGTIAGVQGAITYAACSALPLMIFPVLAPIIRKKSPDGFILTMWVRERYGTVASVYLSFLSCVLFAISTRWRWWC